MPRRYLTMALAASGWSMPVAAQEAPLSWLIGAWCTVADDGIKERSCERWQARADGALTGVSVTHHERFTTLDEHMEIRREGAGYVFHAEPHGQKPADFRARPGDVARQAVTFVNAAHNYPQRIRYWRDGEKLMAEIALANGGKAKIWEYRREGS